MVPFFIANISVVLQIRHKSNHISIILANSIYRYYNCITSKKYAKEERNLGEETVQELSIFEYGQNVLDHFLNPRNVGKVENPDAEVKVGDPSCGDYIELSLRIDQGKIAELKYKVFGCVGAISTSSALSELALGKTMEEAMEITDDEVIAYLKGIPENKRHCSLLGVRGLHEALRQYRSNKNS